MSRGNLFKFVAACALAAGAAACAQAQEGVVTIVVPFPAGGSQDAVGRYMAEKLGARLGVPVIVENKAGAGGIIAADSVARSKDDGRTLLLATGGAISIAPFVQKKLSYDVDRDLAPVALVADTPMSIAVSAGSPYQTLGALIDAAKQNPSLLSYGSTGAGTVSNLTGELFAHAAGINLLHVPYRGAAPANIDLIGGQVAAVFTSAGSILPLVESGKARVLGTFSKAHLPKLGDPPTVSQATGLDGMDVPIWVGFMASSAMKPERRAQLEREILSICEKPETKAYFEEQGAVAACASGAALKDVITADSARWKKVVSAEAAT
ncbi:MFS transporter [Achromobacter denitrificans]|uniref:Bug family tripartite tricarboxylate transporter substrate binding protein n=1 Tax=Achromobacter denitrificans TaxID=32002 RepID=UPI000B4CBC34|nr:tripartite tricarboxylate transporter substrate binding protein [Achromobacter denitrificans]ASC67741.1 MFS transporter [Achromobacter denitrificans]